MKIRAETQLVIPGAQADVFAAVVHIDVPAVFRGRGLVAAVKEVREQKGAWDQVGERRQIILADGGSLWEEITAYQAPHRFDYVLGGIKGALALLVSSVQGEWHYQAQTDDADGAEQSLILWRYDFVVRHSLIYPVTWLFVRFLWMPYMRQVMQHIAEYLRTRKN